MPPPVIYLDYPCGDRGSPVLQGKAQRRFYEPIKLNLALGKQFHASRATVLEWVERSASPESDEDDTPDIDDDNDSDKEKFKKFVYRLATVCATRKKGDYVTSVVVLKRDSKRIVYAFGSNNINSEHLQKVQSFLGNLLRKIACVRGQEESTRDRVFRKAQRLIWEFNQPRIGLDIEQVQKSVSMCVRGCETKTSLWRELKELESTIDVNQVTRLNPGEFCQLCRKVRQAITGCTSNGNWAIIGQHRQAAAEDADHAGTPRDRSCWADLSHWISRFDAYERALNGFLDAADKWPELFSDFEVVAIPSAQPRADPLGRASESAENIIGRMSPDSRTIADYRALCANLQPLALDVIIEELPRSALVVHSEILVLNWVEAEMRLHPDRYVYFNDWKYIGASKPTCRLCHWYFQAHLGQVGVRDTHGNLYSSWRAPDVPDDLSSVEKRSRKNLVDTVRTKMREDTFILVQNKQPWGARHDSNTYDTFSTRSADSDDTVTEADEIASMLGSMTVSEAGTPGGVRFDDNSD